MSNPLRDERAAFRAVLVVLGAFGLLALATWLDPRVGLAVTALEAVAAVAITWRARHRSSTGRPSGRRAPAEGADGRAPRLLVVLGPDGADDADVIERAAGIVPRMHDVLCLVPALDPRARTWSAAAERRVADAERRLSQAVQALSGSGAAVQGTLDDVDPERAVASALRSFGPTEAVVSGAFDAAASAAVVRRLGLEAPATGE